VETFGQGNFTHFPFGRFRVRYVENPLGKIDVFPSLGGDLATPHARVERNNEHCAEVAGGGAEEQLLLGDTQDLAADPPLAHHFQAGQWIHSEKLLIYGPI